MINRQGVNDMRYSIIYSICILAYAGAIAGGIYFLLTRCSIA